MFKENFFKYNPKILYKETKRLYNLAGLIIVGCIFFFFILAFILKYLLVHFKVIPVNDVLLTSAIYLCFILLGMIAGLQSTFKLRLEAQKILCIMEIKNNTDRILEKIDKENSSENGEKENKSSKFTLENDDEFTM